MALSDEDLKRIEEEERARRAIQAKLDHEEQAAREAEEAAQVAAEKAKKQRGRNAGCLIAMGVLGLCLFSGFIMNLSGPSPATRSGRAPQRAARPSPAFQPITPMERLMHEAIAELDVSGRLFEPQASVIAEDGNPHVLANAAWSRADAETRLAFMEGFTDFWREHAAGEPVWWLHNARGEKVGGYDPERGGIFLDVGDSSPPKATEAPEAPESDG